MQRRRFVLSSLAAGAGVAAALGIGWSLLPPRQRLLTDSAAPAGPGQTALNGWVRIGADDSVTVVCPQAEMGQGVHTGLAMVLADELDADWSRVRVGPAPPDAVYNNQTVVVDGLPFHPDDHGSLQRTAAWLAAKAMRELGTPMTGGSTSIKELWLPMRQAGASARALLVDAAAAAWSVPAAQVTVQRGVLHHAASGRQARFGDFAVQAATLPLPDTDALVLKTPAQWTLIGQPLPRLEASAKVGLGSGAAAAANADSAASATNTALTANRTGSAADPSQGFGIDVQLPGMLYASVRMCPTLGGTVASFDGAAALALPGVRRVLAVGGYHGGTAGVAVIADTPWHALRALDQVNVRWNEAVPAAELSSADVSARLVQLVDAGQDTGNTSIGSTYYRRGNVQAALAGAARTLTATYQAPYLAHATLEPQNCTVRVDRALASAEVWAPTQVRGLARRAAALALGIDTAQVTLHGTWLGGGFGRRLEVDFVGQAAAIARAMPGVPVQTFWSREEDMQHDFYRPATAARLQAGLDAQGRVVAWQQVSAGQAIVPQMVQRLFGLAVPGLGGFDKTAAEGAADQPYAWPHARIAHAAVDLPLPVGFWRSVGHSHHAFFQESFLDEVAHAAGQDPVALRASLLQQHPRALQVLQRVAALSGWGQPLAPLADGAHGAHGADGAGGAGGSARARGVALHQSYGTVVAQVAEVSLAADKTIRVHRIFCVVDCGTAVNPNLVRQQVESGIVFGLSAALHGGIDIDRGRVQQSNFHTQPLVTMANCPDIVTDIIASTEPPHGMGEPPTPPVAPAVANAVFALTGQRLRTLPLRLG